MEVDVVVEGLEGRAVVVKREDDGGFRAGAMESVVWSTGSKKRVFLGCGAVAVAVTVMEVDGDVDFVDAGCDSLSDCSVVLAGMSGIAWG